MLLLSLRNEKKTCGHLQVVMVLFSMTPTDAWQYSWPTNTPRQGWQLWHRIYSHPECFTQFSFLFLAYAIKTHSWSARQ